MVILILIGETVPLPVIHVILVLELTHEFSILLKVGAVGDVNGVAGLNAEALLLHLRRNGAVCTVATTRANPHAEIGIEALCQTGRRCKALRELVLIELPETRVGAVVHPAVIDDVRIERTKLRVLHLSVYLGEGAQNGLIADLLLFVVPRVVLNAELRRHGDVIDVIEEVRLNHAVIRAGGGAGHRGPCGVVNGSVNLGALGLLVDSQAIHGLTGVVARTTNLLAILVHDLRIGSRELAAEEHAVGVERLTKNSALLGSADDGALIRRDSPSILGGAHIEGLKIDVVDLGVELISVGHRDIQELAQVVITVVGNDVLRDGVLGTVEYNGFVLERELLARLLLLVDDVGGILDGSLLELELTRLEKHRGFTLLLRPGLGVQVELLARGELLAVGGLHRRRCHEHDMADILAISKVFVLDIHVDGVAGILLAVLEIAGRNLSPPLILGGFGRSLLGNRRAVLLRAHIELITLDVAVGTALTRIVGEALEGRRPLQGNGQIVRVIGLFIFCQIVARVIVLILRMPEGVRIVVNRVRSVSVVRTVFAPLFLGISLRSPTGLVKRVVRSIILLGALDDELLAALTGSQRSARALVIDLGSLYLAALGN